MSVRLLTGQPWEHLARMEAAYWAIWAVMTPLQSCRTCWSVNPGPCGTERTNHTHVVVQSFISDLFGFKHSEVVLKVKGHEKIECVK